ncbi:hypothetical protein [Staphylococcus sp. GDB8P47P]|uniref:hypothetical protein n=1 Tax=Staphylococcus sp. GDB8P47P TaxID=2804448 RepID=UPI0019530E0D|nr:hypothetical protein [Staphylococcus sp. GDB8P47P]
MSRRKYESNTFDLIEGCTIGCPFMLFMGAVGLFAIIMLVMFLWELIKEFFRWISGKELEYFFILHDSINLFRFLGI